MLTVIFQKCFLGWQSWLSRASSLSWNLGRDMLSKLLLQEEKHKVKSWTLGFETPEVISSIIELKSARRGKKKISAIWLVVAKCSIRPRKGIFNLKQQMLFKHLPGAKSYPLCCRDKRMTKKGPPLLSGPPSRGGEMLRWKPGSLYQGAELALSALLPHAQGSLSPFLCPSSADRFCFHWAAPMTLL